MSNDKQFKQLHIVVEMKFIAALFSGHFKEKASILHKMAKHKCKEEAAANGVGE